MLFRSNKMYMMWWWTPSSSDPIRVAFEINSKIPEELATIQNNLKKWLTIEGYDKTTQEGKEQKFFIQVDTIEEVISLFKKFMN